MYGEGESPDLIVVHIAEVITCGRLGWWRADTVFCKEVIELFCRSHWSGVVANLPLQSVSRLIGVVMCEDTYGTTLIHIPIGSYQPQLLFILTCLVVRSRGSVHGKIGRDITELA